MKKYIVRNYLTKIKLLKTTVFMLTILFYNCTILSCDMNSFYTEELNFNNIVPNSVKSVTEYIGVWKLLYTKIDDVVIPYNDEYFNRSTVLTYQEKIGFSVSKTFKSDGTFLHHIVSEFGLEKIDNSTYVGTYAKFIQYNEDGSVLKDWYYVDNYNPSPVSWTVYENILTETVTIKEIIYTSVYEKINL